MADYGIKISKDNYDVKTCTEDQLIFTSKRDYLKTPWNGVGTVTGAATVPLFLFEARVFFAVERYAVGGEDRASSLGAFVDAYETWDPVTIVFGTGSFKYYFFYNYS